MYRVHDTLIICEKGQIKLRILLCCSLSCLCISRRSPLFNSRFFSPHLEVYIVRKQQYSSITCLNLAGFNELWLLVFSLIGNFFLAAKILRKGCAIVRSTNKDTDTHLGTQNCPSKLRHQFTCLRLQQRAD